MGRICSACASFVIWITFFGCQSVIHSQIETQESMQSVIADSVSRDTFCDQDLALTLTGQILTEGSGPLHFQIVELPKHGAILNFEESLGTLVYRPSPSFVGEDTFFYVASDGFRASAWAQVSVRVVERSDSNLPPVADSISRQIPEDQTLIMELVGADLDGPQSLSFFIGSLSTHGEISLLDPELGNVRYVPDAGFVGSDSFTYRVFDGEDYSSWATVQIEVYASALANHTPTVQSFSVSLVQDHSLAITLRGSDLDQDPLHYRIVSPPSHGLIDAFDSVTGVVVYIPDGGYVGTDSLRYVANDGETDSTVGTVAITVQAATGSGLTNIFFLHHSTGRNLIAEGTVRNHIAAYNSAHGTHFEFWDHDYNYYNYGEPLRNPGGSWVSGENYHVPNDNTDPVGLHTLWTTDNEARTKIMANHEVIAFKSCYPASGITSDATLEQYKTWYRNMRNFFDLHPEKVFVIMSPPPLHPLVTDQDDASRARAFANWLGSSEFLAGHGNLVYFNFFDQLAQADDGSASANMLRAEYRRYPDNPDSHPNALANQTVGPLFTQTLIDAALSH